MDTTILMVMGLLAVVGVLIVVMNKVKRQSSGTDNEIKICKTTGEVCCGGGTNCHKYTNTGSSANSLQYFEDEELDRFKGKSPSDYSPQEIAEWREVICTLQPQEVRGWVTSIHRRGLLIPAEIEELAQKIMTSTPQA